MKLKLIVLGVMLSASVGCLQAMNDKKSSVRGVVAVELGKDELLKLSLVGGKGSFSPLCVRLSDIDFTENDELEVPKDISMKSALQYAALASFMKGYKENKFYDCFFCRVEAGEDSTSLNSSAVPLK